MVRSPKRPDAPEMPLVESQQPCCPVAIGEHYVRRVRDADERIKAVAESETASA